jgi:hypothetical protein
VSDGYLLLYGGSNLPYLGPPLRETWSFHSGTWTNRTSSAGTPPPDDTENPLAYDAADGLVLLFGTMPATSPYVPTSYTYSYHGGQWTNLTGTVGAPPRGRIDAAMAYLPSDREVVLFGGTYTLDPTSAAGDTWGFQGGIWTNLTQGLSPSNRTYASLAYDPSISAGILMGGDPAGWTVCDQWLWEPGPLYDVTFQEIGLAPGTAWSVSAGGTANASSGSMIAFRLPNGTFGYAVQPLANYSANPSRGVVEVNGADTAVIIGFSRAYVVNFTETGLTGGIAWSVTLGSETNRTSAPTITFEVPNSTLAYSVGPVAGFAATRSSGLVTVDGGGVNVAILFAAVPLMTYSVTFVETGLPEGVGWAAIVGGATYVSTGGTITLAEPNGTYGFSVVPPEGYLASPSAGSVMVDGSGVTTGIAFRALLHRTFTVTLLEGGLPGGTVWSAWCTELPSSSLGEPEYGVSQIDFSGLPNGTYSFWVGPVPGYAADPSSGSIGVQGQNVSRVVSFEPTSSTTPAALSPLASEEILAGSIAIAAVAVVVAVLGTRRRPPSAPPKAPTAAEAAGRRSQS